MGHFSINAEPDSIEASGNGLVELGEQLSTRATQVKGTPGEISKDQWAGAARDAVTTEMTALGDKLSTFAPKFQAAGEALKGLARTVRTAKDTTIPSLNRRWDDAQEAYDDAVKAADQAYQRDSANVPAEVTGTARTATMQGLSQNRSNSVGNAESARAGTEGQLNREFNTLVSDLEAAFKTAASTLATSTVVPVPDQTVADFVKAGGSGTRMSWTSPEGTPFPPALGARTMMGDSLSLYDDRRAMEDGRRATELGNKLKDPKHQPTQAELDEFNKLLADNQGEKYFATELMNGLGPRGLLELNGRVATLQGDRGPTEEGPLWNKQMADTVGSIQKNLGLTLATATKDVGGEGQVSWEWAGELTRLGREKFTVGPTDEFNEMSPEGVKQYEVYGYQLLGPLLRNGEFGPEFISFVGGDMVDFEMSQKGPDKDKSEVWDNWNSGYGRLDWTSGYGSYAEGGYDPVAALMVAFKNSPEGARQFFSSVQLFDGSEGSPRLPRVDYLLTDREWPDDRMGNYPDDPDDKGWYDYTPAGLDNLGGALESATKDAGDPNSAHIVSSIVWELTNDEQALGLDNGDDRGDTTKSTKPFMDVDLIPPTLRDSMGNIMANWMPSVHNTFDGQGGETAAYKPGVDLDPYLPGVQDVRASLGEDELRRFLADLGKDQDAYTTVQNAATVYAAAAYDSMLGRTDHPAAENLAALQPISKGVAGVFGALDYGANSAGYRDATEADKKHNDMIDGRFAIAGVAADTAGSALDSAVPVAGTAASSIMGELLDSWKESLQRDSTGRVNFETGIRIDNGMRLTEDLVSATIARNTPPDQLPQELRGKDVSDWEQTDWDIWDVHTKTGSSGAVIAGASTVYQTQYGTAADALNGFYPPK